ncbi:hypothetical protein DL96DRAFT_1677973 [Flagelloscypha sp. PMI_526]|nr:hypothetical protein DL96DRAFT_1677973 [Flagelloscypha sp. PMI_526]
MTFSNTPLDFARAAGAVGLGITSGLVLAFPIFIMPALAKILQPAERLRAWSKLYDVGKAIMPPISAAATTILIYSLFSLPVDSLEREVLGSVTRSTLLKITAFIAASPVPFTLLVMAPGITQLKKAEVADVKGDKASGSGARTDALIDKWSAQHNVRCLIYSIAFSVLWLISL